MHCRICLEEVETSKTINIFTEVHSRQMISDLIMNFAYVEVFPNDDLPKIICPDCFKNLLDVYKFKEKIVKADALLRATHNEFSDNETTKSTRFLNNVYNKTFSEDNLKYQPIVQLNYEETTKNMTAFEQTKPTNSEMKNDKAKQRKMYNCDQCKLSFKSRYSLILHRTVHTGMFPHNCDICKKGFTTKWAMSVHRRIHFEERPFQCGTCDKSFKSKSAQIIHRKIHLGIKRHQCKICGKQFRQIGGLKAHQYTHTDEKPLVCEFCGKNYTSKRALDRHYKMHNGEPRQPCAICGKLYSGDINLKIHMKTVHSEDRIRFPCEVCDKSFSTKSVLKIHMRIHEGVKPYTCDICGKSFRQASVATLHKRVHTGETPFPCLSCDRKFSYKHHLKKHVEKDHAKHNLSKTDIVSSQ